MYHDNHEILYHNILYITIIMASLTDDDKFCAETDAYVDLTIHSIPTIESRLKAIKVVRTVDKNYVKNCYLLQT